jgi:hypothetical protein
MLVMMITTLFRVMGCGGDMALLFGIREER